MNEVEILYAVVIVSGVGLIVSLRSEERRVGKECRWGGSW